jgi:FixJ family two-component response regulator
MYKDREFVTIGLSARYRILAVDADEQALALYRDVLLYEWEEPRTLEAAAAGAPLPEAEGEPPSFQLTACATAEEAVAAVRLAQDERRPYSVALVDIRLGEGEDGVWAAERIREIDSNIEIVVITAEADVSLRELNHRVPPPDKLLYLQKPFRSQELRQLANSLCAKWRAENLLVELNATLLDLVEERTAELNEANQQLKEDIAARKRMLAELQASEERYRLLFEEDITGNFVADPSGGSSPATRPLPASSASAASRRPRASTSSTSTSTRCARSRSWTGCSSRRRSTTSRPCSATPTCPPCRSSATSTASSTTRAT